ncbi:MAG: hypothetical protein QOK48_1308 [Blastocatellia bacterium]|jgi:hypothetical protein|nr:hypothetical protein [Blastocatellia bacterium]
MQANNFQESDETTAELVSAAPREMKAKYIAEIKIRTKVAEIKRIFPVEIPREMRKGFGFADTRSPMADAPTAVPISSNSPLPTMIEKPAGLPYARSANHVARRGVKAIKIVNPSHRASLGRMGSFTRWVISPPSVLHKLNPVPVIQAMDFKLGHYQVIWIADMLSARARSANHLG